jgi:arginyl-tRNA synthetase
LRKAGGESENPDFTFLVERLEKELILNLASFADMFIEATEYLKPSMIADYVNALSDKFNTFYNAHPVLKADSKGLVDARIALTRAIQVVLRNALNLIGVTAPEKM